MFYKIIEQPVEEGLKINCREAIRAIIIQDKKILLVQSNKGDYKLPGGGIEANEKHAECLMREVTEETGYVNCVVKEKLGTVIERKLDEYDERALFQMTSHYYICDLTNNNKIAQQLDKYEIAQEFTPVWVTLDEAIEQNDKILNSLEAEKNSWIMREIYVLKKLKNIISL